MGKYRDDVSERAVRYDLINGMSLTAAAIKYKCSTGLISQIRDDRRTPPEDIPPEELCECCKYRPKAPGNHFLCEVCFKYAEDEDGPALEGHKLPENKWDDILD